MAGSPSAGVAARARPAPAAATPAAAAAKAPRRKSRRPSLASAKTLRTPAGSMKFSGALISRPDMESDFTLAPSFAPFAARRRSLDQRVDCLAQEVPHLGV